MRQILVYRNGQPFSLMMGDDATLAANLAAKAQRWTGCAWLEPETPLNTLDEAPSFDAGKVVFL